MPRKKQKNLPKKTKLNNKKTQNKSKDSTLFTEPNVMSIDSTVDEPNGQPQTFECFRVDETFLNEHCTQLSDFHYTFPEDSFYIYEYTYSGNQVETVVNKQEVEAIGDRNEDHTSHIFKGHKRFWVNDKNVVYNPHVENLLGYFEIITSQRLIRDRVANDHYAHNQRIKSLKEADNKVEITDAYKLDHISEHGILSSDNEENYQPPNSTTRRKSKLKSKDSSIDKNSFDNENFKPKKCRTSKRKTKKQSLENTSETLVIDDEISFDLEAFPCSDDNADDENYVPPRKASKRKKKMTSLEKNSETLVIDEQTKAPNEIILSNAVEDNPLPIETESELSLDRKPEEELKTVLVMHMATKNMHTFKLRKDGNYIKVVADIASYLECSPLNICLVTQDEENERFITWNTPLSELGDKSFQMLKAYEENDFPFQNDFPIDEVRWIDSLKENIINVQLQYFDARRRQTLKIDRTWPFSEVLEQILKLRNNPGDEIGLMFDGDKITDLTQRAIDLDIEEKMIIDVYPILTKETVEENISIKEDEIINLD